MRRILTVLAVAAVCCSTGPDANGRVPIRANGLATAPTGDSACAYTMLGELAYDSATHNFFGSGSVHFTRTTGSGGVTDAGEVELSLHWSGELDSFNLQAVMSPSVGWILGRFQIHMNTIPDSARGSFTCIWQPTFDGWRGAADLVRR